MKITDEQIEETIEDYNKRIDAYLADKAEKKRSQKVNQRIKKYHRDSSYKVWKARHPFQHLSLRQSKQGIFITPQQLWSMAKKQRCLCPISGRKLKNGDIHVDHIIPKSKGGDNTISNLQLVPSIINMSKNCLYIKDFIALCKDVANHQH